MEKQALVRQGGSTERRTKIPFKNDSDHYDKGKDCQGVINK